MIVGYARVSTADQDLDRQLDALREAGCERVWSEHASGGRQASRPEWDACLSHLRAGDTLVVHELSRLGRNASDLARLVEDLADTGVSLRILNLGIDTSTPAGKLVFTIIAAVAEMERELIRERTKHALDAKRKRGGKVGGRPRTITPRQVRRARELLERGDMSSTEVARAVGISRSRMYELLAEQRDTATSTSGRPAGRR